MTSKTQLQSKISELEKELQTFKEQLNNYKEVTLKTAVPGDVLEDGSIVLKKENGLALLVAPASTEVECQWSKEFTEVFNKLQEEGFNPSQWFVPTQEQLRLAHSLIRHHFDDNFYWSSAEFNAMNASGVLYTNGIVGFSSKGSRFSVRAFRCVTY